MPLTFMQNSTRYTGFVRYSSPGQIDFREHRLVLAWFDGEPDLWIVEGGVDGENALRAYYEDEWGPGRVTFQSFTQLPG